MDKRIRNETHPVPRIATRRLAPDDVEYPAHLRATSDAPGSLYVRGALVPEDALAVAVVGSRRATAYGLEVAEALAFDLASRGVTVVSGLARGIDTAAHRGALRAGGRTLAVLGSGVDVIYPPENRSLAAAIERGGAVLSMFAPGTPAFAHHFPIRNRVIAGLALGVVVVEAAERSGALITAGIAGELGREVMAVPGRIDSGTSRGAHALIRDGAALVESAADVVAALPRRWRDGVRESRDGGAAQAGGAEALGAPDAMPAGDPDLRAVLDAVGGEPMTMDEVIEQSGRDSGRVAALLLELELMGQVRQMAGKRFVRVGASHPGR